MNKEEKSATKQDQRSTQEENNSGQQPFNPFDKSANTSSQKEALKEAEAEQQRKETLTERD